MPENPSSPEDPLADLYGRLPSPRSRDTAPRPESAPPVSRREARAARAETGATATSVPPLAGERASQAPSSPAAERPAARTATATATPPAGERAVGAGTLDDLFTGRRSIDEVGTAPPPSEKRRRRTGGWVALAIAVILVGGIAAGGVWLWNTFGTQVQGFFAPDEREDFEAGMANGEATITIAEGDAGPQVSQKLFDAGVLKSPTSLYDYMIDESSVFTFQPGVFRLQKQMTSEAALAALDDPANRLENTAQLREGLTVEDSLTVLSEQMGMPREELAAAAADPSVYGVNADRLEGWLFPATYTFNPGATATDVIRTLVDRTVQSLDDNGVPVDDRQRVLTVASIIEREARLPDDFYRVSRVIQNRLDQGMQLQMDSTAQYGYGELSEGSVSTSDEAQFDENAYNTYVVPALPAGPIANPGDRAIDAAMHPAEGSWLFFVTVNLHTGETVFTSNADDHEAARQQWIQWCRDTPDSGC